MQVSLAINKNRLIKKAIVALLICVGLYQAACFMWGDDYLVFFKGIIRNPMQVGAMSPCSTFVCREVTKYIAQEPADKPLRILEVGGGSGVFTRQLEKVLMGRQGAFHVDVVEIDPEYADLLTNRFKDNPHFTVHCCNIIDFNDQEPYDYIVSSLPFSTIDHEIVAAILQKYSLLIKKDGGMCYVEHIWLPDIKEYFLSGSEKEEFKMRRQLVKDYRDQYLFETKRVYWNLTPLFVYHLKIN